MDLRFRGHAELAAVYRDAVLADNGDREMEILLPMLVRYRAMVWAKVAVITARETELPHEARTEAADDARAYLRLAAVSAVEEDGPLWFLFCGLPASGKSCIAEALAASSRGGWSVLSSDHIRKELAGIAPTEKLPPECYDDAFSRRTYDELRRRAAEEKGVVILDANFRTRRERLLTRDAALASGARLVILRIETDEVVVLQRLAARADDPAAVSDADRAVYEKLKSALEPPDDGEADRLLLVSGDIAADAAVDGILAALVGDD